VELPWSSARLKYSLEKTMRKLKLSRQIVGMSKNAILALIIATAIGANVAIAQNFSVLHDFGTYTGDATYPAWIGSIVQARDGNLYSTTSTGGAYNLGAIFQLTPNGQEKIVYSFNRPLAFTPSSGLTLGNDGALYGTTGAGGTNMYDAGTVFRFTTGGQFTVLHTFNTNDGAQPEAPPIQAADGSWYGTTHYGAGGVWGTVYKISPSGVFKSLVQGFGHPSALTLGTDGNLYGTTLWPGGTKGGGTIFKITPQGTLNVLYNFAGGSTDGWDPRGCIIQASDGNFYGTTYAGGTNNLGTVYKMTPAGVVKVIYSFENTSTNPAGNGPFAGLVQATDGKFYGATYGGGGLYGSAGVLFQVTSTPTYKVLYPFSATIGAHPIVSLLQHTNGKLYGDTYEGAAGPGMAYSLGMGLGPFVTFLRAQSVGKVGKTIGIFGQSFNGATKVSFNGAASSFTIVSDTYLTATVPNGAKTGPITVTAFASTLKSNTTFRVTPQITSFTPASGSVGSKVTITGVSLAQTTKVTIGGKNATFIVVNDSTVTARVPTGAVTGKTIAITTAGGSATSPSAFTLI
jgi:uncharacterized repeat protein (TIGR03803 family)